MKLQDGKYYHLGGHTFKASNVTSTHAQLDPYTRGAALHVVAFEDVYRVDATGNTQPSGFGLADLEEIKSPERQSTFPWAPKGKRRRMTGRRMEPAQ